MPLAIFEQLGLDTPSPTIIRLLMVDHSIKRLVDILHDVLVKVEHNCEVDMDVQIILSRPFLAIGRELVDVERGDLKFRDE